MSTESVRVDGRTIEVTNAGKVLFPRDGITKSDLVDYYRRAAPAMLRYLRGRPVTMRRYPDGINEEGFFQKQVSDHFPAWVPRATVSRKEGGDITHVVCDDAPTLAYLADQACITPHVWLSYADAPDKPDRLVFDLDPSGDDLDLLRSAARSVRALLEEIGLVPYVMTSGSRGFHVATPLRRNADFGEVRRFAQGVATLLARREPDRLTAELPKQRRGDRVFVDYLRNSYAQTSVPPYAVRARTGAPVATPLRWDEVDNVEPRQFTTRNVLDRIAVCGDPWAGSANRARSLRAPQRRLERLLGDGG